MLQSTVNIVFSLMVTCAAQLVLPEIPPDVVKAVLPFSPEASACERACSIVAKNLPDTVFLGQTGNFDFWDAKQREIVAVCRVEPNTAQDVSFVLRTVIEQNCAFAVKSGGHERTAGASNADGGLTIDLVRLKEIDVAKDRHSVTIGPGWRWGELYHRLEKEELLVLGGRIADVGVGGLLLGGGISFFSNERGLACDSILSYELVLPNATVITVNQETQPKLFRALRGSGAMNYGVVTAFTLEAFPHSHRVWSGRKTIVWDHLPELLEANHEITTKSFEKDPGMAVMNIFMCYPKYGVCYGNVVAVHTMQNTSDSWPSSFAPLESIESVPHAGRSEVGSYAKVTGQVEDQVDSSRYRTIYATFSYIPSIELELELLTIFREEVQRADVKDITGFLPGVIMHPFSRTMLQGMHKRGGNAFSSIADRTTPLTVLNIAWQWNEKVDDKKVYASYRRIMTLFEAAAKERDLWHPYKYINYAEASQDVWEGYGMFIEDLERLQKQLDPLGVFAKGGLAGGVHKIRGYTESRYADVHTTVQHNMAFARDEL